MQEGMREARRDIREGEAEQEDAVAHHQQYQLPPASVPQSLIQVPVLRTTTATQITVKTVEATQLRMKGVRYLCAAGAGGGPGGHVIRCLASCLHNGSPVSAGSRGRQPARGCLACSHTTCSLCRCLQRGRRQGELCATPFLMLDLLRRDTTPHPPSLPLPALHPHLGSACCFLLAQYHTQATYLGRVCAQGWEGVRCGEQGVAVTVGGGVGVGSREAP